jgi:glucoamylase
VDIRRMSWGLGMVPEQAWEDPNYPASPYGSDPTTASIGFKDGLAAGSAAPLIWAQAQYVRLLRDLQTGKVLDQPDITRTRYVSAGAPTVLALTITSPAPGASVPSSSTVVSGMTTPGGQVAVSAGQPGSATNPTSVVETSAPDGHFSVTVPTPSGTTVITAAVTTGSHSSGWAQETVTGP